MNWEMSWPRQGMACRRSFRWLFVYSVLCCSHFCIQGPVRETPGETGRHRASRWVRGHQLEPWTSVRGFDPWQRRSGQKRYQATGVAGCCYRRGGGLKRRAQMCPRRRTGCSWRREHGRVADIAGPLPRSEEGFEIIYEDRSLVVYLRAVCSEGWEAARTRKFRRCAPVVCAMKFPDISGITGI